MSAEKKRIRELFRCAVFERDDHQCRICGRPDHLDAHHITDRNYMPNGGYVVENGITLCARHHFVYEKTHDPEFLYYLIQSSYELAVEKDNENSFI